MCNITHINGYHTSIKPSFHISSSVYNNIYVQYNTYQWIPHIYKTTFSHLLIGIYITFMCNITHINGYHTSIKPPFHMSSSVYNITFMCNITHINGYHTSIKHLCASFHISSSVYNNIYVQYNTYQWIPHIYKTIFSHLLIGI